MTILRTDDAQIVNTLYSALGEHYKSNVQEQCPDRITLVQLSPEIIGGATGVLAWDWFELEVIWVKPSCRRNGLGGTLLRRIEDEAAAFGVRGVSLRCIGEEAAGFYTRRGYLQAGLLADFPSGFIMSWLYKPFIGS